MGTKPVNPSTQALIDQILEADKFVGFLVKVEKPGQDPYVFFATGLNVNSFRLGGGEAVYVTGRRPEDGVAAAAQAEHLTILPRGVLT